MEGRSGLLRIALAANRSCLVAALISGTLRYLVAPSALLGRLFALLTCLFNEGEPPGQALTVQIEVCMGYRQPLPVC